MMTKEQRWAVLICVILGLGTVLLYWPAASFDFVTYDDPEYVYNNYHVKGGLTWHAFAWCFQAGYGANWHPLTWISHILDCQFFGLKPGGHHVTNLLLHAVNSVLLFLALRSLTGALWRSAMVAGLFAWHPLHVESVAWISERKDVLSTLFWILTIWAYVNYVRKRGLARYALAIVLFILGLMSKPMVVTLPFVLLLLDWWPLGRFQSKPARSPWPILLEKAPFFLLAVASCLITLVAQHRGEAIVSLQSLSLSDRAINSAISYLRYVEKTFWPVNLSIIYPLIAQWQGQEKAAAAFFMIVVSVGALILLKSRPYCTVGWLWYLGTLVPVIGLVQVGAQSMADRYTYIPLIGIFIVVCWGAFDLARHWPFHRLVLGFAGVAILAACAASTSKELRYWKDSSALYERALQIDPDNYLVHTYYGAYFRDQHEYEKARAQCEQAVQLAPGYAIGHVFLSGVLLLEGKNDECINEIRAALAYDPNLFMARINLGDLLLAEGKYSEAGDEYRKCVSYKPDEPKLYYSLGRALAAQKKFDEAHAEFEAALRLDPSYVDAHYELAVTLDALQKHAEAAGEYRIALQLKPNFSDALNNLAWILAANPDPQLRNGAEAVVLAGHACALTHNTQAIKIGTLAAAYAEAGRFGDAVVTAQLAHDVAVAHNQKDVAAANLTLQKLYKAHQAYHEPAPGSAR